MTREEALEVINSHPFLFASFPDDVIEALDVLIKQEPVIDKIRGEIADYGSICVSYAITGRKDSDIERLVKSVLKQAKEQVLDIIDKYKAESEE